MDAYFACYGSGYRWASLKRAGCSWSETGTGQGQTISPLLANIYLHGVLDEWFENEVKPRLRGEVHEIRFADDAVLCFQYKEDADKVMEVLPKRFAKYGLTIHPEKTRLLEFNDMQRTKRRGRGRNLPRSISSALHTSVPAAGKGNSQVHVRTMKKRFRRGLQAIAEWCQENRHLPVEEQQKTLNAKLRATTSITGDRRITAVSGGSFGRSGTSGISGSAAALVERDDLGEICSHPTDPSPVATAYPPLLAWCGESRLRNPLR